jgi:hypothetical protein
VCAMNERAAASVHPLRVEGSFMANFGVTP